MRFQERESFDVVVVVGVDVGVERSGVDKDRYWATSSRRISSIRTETSWDPLLPAPAAIIRRRPVGRDPRWLSMASLVSSETVTRLRSASWRSRASRSSGSLTVVRFMVCQHTYLLWALPDRDVRGALAGERRTIPIRPTVEQRQAGQSCHQVELGWPHVAPGKTRLS